LSSAIEGAINDKLQMLGESDFDGAQIRVNQVKDKLQLVKEVHESRFHCLYYASDAGDEYLYIYVPKGKVWKISELRMMLTTDANVANRTFHIKKEFLRPNETYGPLKQFIEATVAASTSYTCELHAAASADPPAAIDSLLDRDHILLIGSDLKGQAQQRLSLRAEDREAGDRMYVHMEVEERSNYML